MRIRWREFELPNRVVHDESVSNATYGLFVAEPFERGFGHTIGNGLRRVLLSSLEGAAVTHVRVQGVQHEFATIEGVVEDMTEIVLNVKKLLVTSESTEPRTLRLKADQKGPVTASLFQETNDVEVVNKDLKGTGNVDAAKAVGREIAARAKAAGISKVAFDRSGFRFHGRVKALADAAREAGLEF